MDVHTTLTNELNKNGSYSSQINNHTYFLHLLKEIHIQEPGGFSSRKQHALREHSSPEGDGNGRNEKTSHQVFCHGSCNVFADGPNGKRNNHSTDTCTAARLCEFVRAASSVPNGWSHRNIRDSYSDTGSHCRKTFHLHSLQTSSVTYHGDCRDFHHKVA